MPCHITKIGKPSRANRPKLRHLKNAIRAMQLRISGMRYAEIAAKLGVSEQHA